MMPRGLSSILRINRRRIQTIQAQLQPYDYAGVMHLIVLRLGKCPGASQDDIATFFSIDKGSVARDAKKLEDMGHIRREVDPANRRQYKLFLTGEGEEMRRNIRAMYDAFYRRLTSGLSPQECAELERLLALAEDNAYA